LNLLDFLTRAKIISMFTLPIFTLKMIIFKCPKHVAAIHICYTKPVPLHNTLFHYLLPFRSQLFTLQSPIFPYILHSIADSTTSCTRRGTSQEAEKQILQTDSYRIVIVILNNYKYSRGLALAHFCKDFSKFVKRPTSSVRNLYHWGPFTINGNDCQITFLGGGA
jgi:hypothetical protein